MGDDEFIFSITINKNPNTVSQLCYRFVGIFILAHIVLLFVHWYQLLLEVSELKAELQKKSSAVPCGGTGTVQNTIFPG